ncbi:MAG: glycosyltransferase family 9 protein [Pyrinomonadaceae bacterium]
MDLKRILIFRIGHLGDTLAALPAFWVVRGAFPKAHISLLTNSDPKNPHYVSPSSILPQNELVDSVLSYPAGSTRAKSIFNFLGLARKIRKGRYDAVIYLMTRNRMPNQIERDVRFFRFCGIRRVIGAQFLKENYLSFPIPIPTPTVIPESAFLLEMLRQAGFDTSGDDKSRGISLTDFEISAANNWFHALYEETPGRRLVAIAPGSKWRSKVWRTERYIKVINRLIGSHNIFPIIFGGPEDRSVGETILQAVGIGANAAGKLGVREAAAALARCELYLGNDTGTMHMAAAVGTPCVAVFAAIDWIGRWYPTGQHNVVFRKRVECEGCHTPDCFNNHKCLELTSTAEVYAACANVLDELSIESHHGP